jgi:hypothetical protein
VSERKTYRLADRTPLTPAQPFTPLELRDLVATAAGGGYAPLADAAAVQLCSVLSQHHAWFYCAQAERSLNGLFAEASAAADRLAHVLPLIRDVLRDRNAAVSGADPFLARQIKDAERATAFVEVPMHWQFLYTDSLPDTVRDWRWLADVLPADIKTAMRPTNPTFRAGVSKTGPLARILEAIIPRVSGEHPTASAIGTQLGKLARRPNDNLLTGDIGQQYISC